MNVNVELYRVFYTVCKYQNITKASEVLLISQPAVSRSIKNLEDQLNTTLFIRNKRGVILTDNGKILYNDIKIAMEIIDKVEEKMKMIDNLEYGTLRIGVSKTITQNFLLPYIAKFNEMYPNINIDICTDPTKDLIKTMENGLIDIIILNLPYKMPNNFYVEELMEIHDVFIANYKYKELFNKTIPLGEVDKYPLILPAHGSNTRYFLDDLCRKNDITLKPKMELASNSLVVDFALNGIGIGLATLEYIKDYLDDSKLFEIKVTPEIPKRHIGLSYSKDISLNKITNEFIKVLKDK